MQNGDLIIHRIFKEWGENDIPFHTIMGSVVCFDMMIFHRITSYYTIMGSSFVDIILPCFSHDIDCISPWFHHFLP